MAKRNVSFWTDSVVGNQIWPPKLTNGWDRLAVKNFIEHCSLNGNQIQYSHHGPWLDFVKYFEFTWAFIYFSGEICDKM